MRCTLAIITLALGCTLSSFAQAQQPAGQAQAPAAQAAQPAGTENASAPKPAAAQGQIAMLAPLRCADPVARIASVQGLVELREPRTANWQRAQLNDALCLNDNIRVGPNSRASFQYASDVTVQLDQNTFVTLVEAKDKVSIWTQMWRGALHFITRSRKPFRVITPFANASVEGTEVYIALAKDRADLTVFEGKLDVANDAGQVLLSGGESAVVQGLEAITDDDQFRTLKAQAPQRVLVAKPRDAVQWALYYPPVVDVRTGDNVHPSLRAAAEQFRAGKTAEAFAELDRVPADSWDAQYFIYRASLLLYVGREQEAQAELAQALQKDDAKKSDVYALQTIIAVVQSNKEQGLSLAQKAVEADPSSAAAQIALSYAQQAVFKLEAALQSAEQAAKLDPNSALAYARIAELQLSQGDLDKALVAAKKATELNPNLARTQSILGFSYLTRIDTKNAKETFGKAIQLDSADPLPHLGLGLAKIREGHLEEGRRDIEQAVILDPNNSLIRSYVGKAYYEEKRDELAGKQFEIAKELDPNDPTPYFYDAVRRQSSNQSDDALSQLSESMRLNNNRLAYRSNLLLDADLAVRGISLAQGYESLGFGELAKSLATEAATLSPSENSSHRFLAETYAGAARHEIARVSELLQAKLRQPVTFSLSEPELSEDRLGATRTSVFNGLGAAQSSIYEYASLFERSGPVVRLDAFAAQKETTSNQFILSASGSRIGASIGQFHYRTDGFEANSDVKKDVYSGLVQFTPRAHSTVQFEIRRATSKRGETLLAFDPDFAEARRVDEEVTNYRLGLYQKIGTSAELLVSAMQQQKEFVHALVDNPPDTLVESDWTMGELQYVGYGRDKNVIVGISRFKGKDDLTLGGPFLRRVTHDLAYLYSYAWLVKDTIGVSAGASYDHIDSVNLNRNSVNPKIGLLWRPTAATKISVASFKTVKRQIIANETIEPTHVLGFNQFFDDPTGSVVRVRGAAIDQRFSQSLAGGIRITKRGLKVPGVTATGFTDNPWDEGTRNAYLYWLLPKSVSPAPLKSFAFALSAEYVAERFDRDGEAFGDEGFVDFRRTTIPIGLSAQHPNGLGMRISANRVFQEGRIQAFPGTTAFLTNDSAWITDIDVSYRLPKRRGTLSIGGRNIFQKRANFRGGDTGVLSVFPERFVFVRAGLVF